MVRVSVDLSETMAKQIRGISDSQTLGNAVVRRAQCVRLACQGLSYIEISQQVSLSAKTVGRWVRRFADSIEALRHIEGEGVAAALRRAILDCLSDAPRSGAPKFFLPNKSFRLSRSPAKIPSSPIARSPLGRLKRLPKKVSCDRSCLRFQSLPCSDSFAT